MKFGAVIGLAGWISRLKDIARTGGPQRANLRDSTPLRCHYITGAGRDVVPRGLLKFFKFVNGIPVMASERYLNACVFVLFIQNLRGRFLSYSRGTKRHRFPALFSRKKQGVSYNAGPWCAQIPRNTIRLGNQVLKLGANVPEAPRPKVSRCAVKLAPVVSGNPSSFAVQVLH